MSKSKSSKAKAVKTGPDKLELLEKKLLQDCTLNPEGMMRKDYVTIDVTRDMAAVCAASYFLSYGGKAAVKLFNQYYARRFEMIPRIVHSQFPGICSSFVDEPHMMTRAQIFYGAFLAEDRDEVADLLEFAMAECTDLRDSLIILGAPEELVSQAQGGRNGIVSSQRLGLALWVMKLLDLPIMIHDKYSLVVSIYQALSYMICRNYLGVYMKQGIQFSKYDNDKLAERVVRKAMNDWKESDEDVPILDSPLFAVLYGRPGEHNALDPENLDFATDLIHIFSNYYDEKIAVRFTNDCLQYYKVIISLSYYVRKNMSNDTLSDIDESYTLTKLRDLNEEMRDKLELAKNGLKQSKSQYDQMKLSRDELSRRLNEVTRERDKLKQELQNMTPKAAPEAKPKEPEKEAEQPPFIPTPEQMERLRNTRVAVIGGHDRMRDHIEEDFPDWIFLNNKFPKEPLMKADVILVLTRYIAHKISYRVAAYTENTPAADKVLNTGWKNKDLVYKDVLEFLDKRFQEHA